MKRVVFGVLAAVAIAANAVVPALAKGDPKPDGLTPSSVAASEVLKAYHAALGTRDSSARPVTTEDWSYNLSGVDGTERLVRQGTDYHAHLTYGPLSEDFGQFLGRAWHRDFNGVSTQSSGGDYFSFSMLIFMRVADEVDDPKFDIRVLGEVSSPRPAVVVAVSKKEWDYPDWFFFDKSTGLIDRIVRLYDNYRITLTFDDYQKTLGVERPTHIHSSISDNTEETDYKRTAFSVAASAGPNTFLAPPSQHAFAQFNGMSWLPTRMINRAAFTPLGRDGWMLTQVPQIVVPVMVNGRRLDFGISSGLSRSIIDSGVAGQLGLPTFGRSTRGDVSYETVLPDANVGNLTLKNLVLRAESFYYHPAADTKIVGVLGADVLSAGVVKMDFTNGSMLLMPPNSFGGASPDKKAIDVPIDIDDGQPFARGMVAGVVSNNMLIDNDEDFSATFGSFASSLPGWSDREGKGASATIPFAGNRSFGSDYYFWPGAFDLEVGPLSFQNISLLGTEMSASDYGRDVDAIIGSDILRYYDMYLDYQHGHIYLKPNADFSKRFGTAQQGGR